MMSECKESESLKKEIVEQYHCGDFFGEGCDGDCAGCRGSLSYKLDEFEKMAIDEFKQKSYGIIGEIITHSNLEINQQLTIYAQIMGKIDTLEEQLKEQKV